MTNPETARRTFITQKEAAHHARVSPRTIRRWAACGFIETTRPAGGRVLVVRESLQQFLMGEAA
jgi:excisionase family DNA binding protein